MLSYNSDYDSPSIDINLPAAITADNVNDFIQPAANTNNSSGFSVKDATNAVLGLLDNGYQIYQSVSSKIGGAKAKADQNTVSTPKTTVLSPTNPSFVLGLSTNQLLLIAGGLAAILILPRLIRR